MNFLSLLAMSAPAGGEAQNANPFFTFLPIILIFVVFWFMIIRPQKKQQDQRKTMIEALKRGDKVITNGGLHAVIKDVKNDYVVASIAEGVKVQISKSAIGAVYTEQE